MFVLWNDGTTGLDLRLGLLTRGTLGISWHNLCKMQPRALARPPEVFSTSCSILVGICQHELLAPGATCAKIVAF